MEQQQLEYLIGRVEAMDTKYDEKLDKILIQTTKTNGRVSSLEKNFERTQSEVELLKDNRSEVKGRDRAIWVILIAVGTVAGFTIEHLLFKK